MENARDDEAAGVSSSEKERSNTRYCRSRRGGQLQTHRTPASRSARSQQLDDRPSKTPEIGDVIDGKYTLLRLLGEGGMGKVYEAVHVHIGKRLAIKVLHSDLAHNDVMVERFRQEARAAALVEQPGVIDITDVGVTADGVHYLVMERLDGECLADILRRRHWLEPELAVAIACQLLVTLAAAHDRGVIHRDVKPANIFIVDSGHGEPTVKLLDFGIAKVTESRAYESGDAVDGGLTNTGSYLGTPHYMAPEQALGFNKSDQRSDLFAVGVVLYRCLTGQLPFKGQRGVTLLHSMISDQPTAPGDHRPDLAPDLCTAVLDAIQSEPDRRFQSAVEMLAALLPFLHAESGLFVTPLPYSLTLDADPDAKLAREVTKIESNVVARQA